MIMSQITLNRESNFNMPFFTQDFHLQEYLINNVTKKTVFFEKEIKLLLNFYKDEYIYIKQVEVKDGIFYFTFKKFDYPYFKSEVHHLTREQTIAFITQAAYFFGLINNHFDSNWNYSTKKFYNYVQDEKMGFTDISIKYRKFTANVENSLLIFNPINYRKYNNKLFGSIGFELEKYCSGKMNFFIDL